MEQFLDTFMHHWFWGSEEAIFLATFFAGIVVSAICYHLSVVFNDEWIYATPIFFFFLAPSSPSERNRPAALPMNGPTLWWPSGKLSHLSHL